MPETSLWFVPDLPDIKRDPVRGFEAGVSDLRALRKDLRLVSIRFGVYSSSDRPVQRRRRSRSPQRDGRTELMKSTISFRSKTYFSL